MRKIIMLCAMAFALQACTDDSNDTIKRSKESEEAYVKVNVLEITLSDGTHCAIYRHFNITCGWRPQ